jgi:adenosine deaminase
MSIEAFIRAMPKVELNARLEGAFRKEILMSIADENEISAEIKRFDELVSAFDEPDCSKLAEHVRTYMEWIRHPDDLSRLVYDAGLALSRQNVRYVEMSVNLGLHMLSGMSFEAFMEAINDGRSRVERGWGIRMAWILTVMRDEPRLADDTIRWAASPAGRKQGIVGFGLLGSELSQPAGQFERAFATAAKKEVPSVAQAGDTKGAEGVHDVLKLLPKRLIDAWGILDDPDLLEQLANLQMPVVANISRAVCMNWITTPSEYALRELYDADIKVVLGSSMPNVYGSTLSDEYLTAVNECGFSVEELKELALNGVDASFLPSEEKEDLRGSFEQVYAGLEAEHLSPSETV